MCLRVQLASIQMQLSINLGECISKINCECQFPMQLKFRGPPVKYLLSIFVFYASAVARHFHRVRFTHRQLTNFTSLHNNNSSRPTTVGSHQKSTYTLDFLRKLFTVHTSIFYFSVINQSPDKSQYFNGLLLLESESELEGLVYLSYYFVIFYLKIIIKKYIE